MKAVQEEFREFLAHSGLLSREQLHEATELQRQRGISLMDAVVKLGYASPGEILRALAAYHRMLWVDLASLAVPPSAIELIPESVARENLVLPLAQYGGTLLVAVSNPFDRDTLQKLMFILNKEVHAVLAAREQLIEAINRYYGETETETVGSMLQEFTDCQIDFTTTAGRCDYLDDATDLCESDFDIALDSSEGAALDEEGCAVAALDEEGAAVSAPGGGSVVACAAVDEEESAQPQSRPRRVERQATVRYYHRMNPEKTFPLLVVLSEKKILEIAQRGVAQKTGKRFEIQAESVVEVEPILPGCTCYPPRETLRVRPGEATARFWVVPHVLGKVMHARVVVRQDGEVLTEVPLEIRVVKQTVTVLMAALTCVLPLIASLMQHFGIDLRAKLQDGWYSRLAASLFGSVSPDILALFLLAATCGLYLWLRPRKRDLFWEVTALGGQQAPRVRAAEDGRRQADGIGEKVAPQPPSGSARLARAEQEYRRGNFREALALYRKALETGKAPASAYHRAALAANHLGKNAQALTLLRKAVEHLPDSEIPAAMWYNMGCFAARLGLQQDAMRYLCRAVDGGYLKVKKFQSDPDLDPLRGRSDFKALVACLDS